MVASMASSIAGRKGMGRICSSFLRDGGGKKGRRKGLSENGQERLARW